MALLQLNFPQLLPMLMVRRYP